LKFGGGISNSLTIISFSKRTYAALRRVLIL